MTPKEKAERLINRMYVYTSDFSNNGAKQCALIVVEEALKITAPDCDRHELYYQKLEPEQTRKYWEEVESEIEELKDL